MRDSMYIHATLNPFDLSEFDEAEIEHGDMSVIRCHFIRVP